MKSLPGRGAAVQEVQEVQTDANAWRVCSGKTANASESVPTVAYQQ